MASRYKGHSGSYFTGNNRLVKLNNKHSRNSTEPKSPISSTRSTYSLKTDMESVNTTFFESLVSTTNYLKHIIEDFKSKKSLKNQQKKASLSSLMQELNTLNNSN